jgi:putative solute:sodium symporter small subunit
MTEVRRRVFWRSTKRLTAALLLAWLALNLIGPWFARDLDRLRAFGFPFGFWVAAQGALLLYLLIIVVYVRCMDRLEARYLRSAQVSDEGPGAGPV